MTLQLGTIDGITLLQGSLEGVGPIAGPPTTGARKAYLLVCTFPAYTGSTDTAQVTGVGANVKGTKVGDLVITRSYARDSLCVEGMHFIDSYAIVATITTSSK